MKGKEDANHVVNTMGERTILFILSISIKN